MAKNSLKIFSPNSLRLGDFGISDVVLSSNYPSISISRIIFDEIKDRVSQDQTPTSIFRKIMYTLLPEDPKKSPEESIWTTMTGLAIRESWPAQYGAAKGSILKFSIKYYRFNLILN